MANYLLEKSELELAPNVPAYLTDIWVDNAQRGNKRTVSLTFIVNKALYTLNGIVKCDKQQGCEQPFDNDKAKLFK